MQDALIIRDNFKKELELASDGDKSSLPYIKVNLPSSFEHDIPDKYQVIVMGGTNFSSAMVRRNGFDIELYDTKKDKFDKFKSKNDLFSFILERVSSEIDTICVNFAFPLEPVLRDNRLDGKLMAISKDHKFSDLIGENVGEGLEKFILEKSGRKVKVSIENDTICLLMSGLSVSNKKNIVGAILGTGFNLGIFADELIAVNIEAANFDKFEPSEEVLAIDKDTTNEGQHLFEKEIAGNYLYKHFNYILQSKNIDYRPINSTSELFAVVHGDTQNEKAREIADGLFKHSAKYLAASISAIAEYKKDDIDVIIQGGMFTDYYKELLMDEIIKLTEKRITLCEINDSSRLGAAFLI